MPEMKAIAPPKNAVRQVDADDAKSASLDRIPEITKRLETLKKEMDEKYHLLAAVAEPIRRLITEYFDPTRYSEDSVADEVKKYAPRFQKRGLGNLIMKPYAEYTALEGEIEKLKAERLSLEQELHEITKLFGGRRDSELLAAHEAMLPIIAEAIKPFCVDPANAMHEARGLSLPTTLAMRIHAWNKFDTLSAAMNLYREYQSPIPTLS